MKQLCLQCGAEYSEPTGRCLASVRRDVVMDSEIVPRTFPCGSRQWSYPADEVPALSPVAATIESGATPKVESHQNDFRGQRRK